MTLDVSNLENWLMRIFLALLEVYDASGRGGWGEVIFLFWYLNTFLEFDYSAY